ncbi:hypothetical protein N665_2051s0011 [Sinapis alba]|nr:hypothetical protein N665_2051s0010 [Sinapis alba]KAF8050076.1 hypothetical protein N665_2051s0011 [Sinapis alba]
MYPIVPLVSSNDNMLSFFSQSLARPKSDTFGQRLSSNSTLCGFMSKCTILVLHPWCKYSKPRATPSAIPYKSRQSIIDGLLLEMSLSRDPFSKNS